VHSTLGKPAAKMTQYRVNIKGSFGILKRFPRLDNVLTKKGGKAESIAS